MKKNLLALPIISALLISFATSAAFIPDKVTPNFEKNHTYGVSLEWDVSPVYNSADMNGDNLIIKQKLSLKKGDIFNVLNVNNQWEAQEIIKWNDHTFEFNKQLDKIAADFLVPESIKEVKIKETIEDIEIPNQVKNNIVNYIEYANDANWSKTGLSPLPIEKNSNQDYELSVKDLDQLNYKNKYRTFRSYYNSNDQISQQPREEL